MKTVINGAGLDNTATAKLWLLQNRNMFVQDLYQIGPYTPFGAPASGTAGRTYAPLQYYWTDADYPIKSTYLNTTYYPQRIERGSLKYEVGTKPSEYQFTVYTQEAQQPLVYGDSSVRGHPPYQDAIMTVGDSAGNWTLAQTLKQALANGDLDGVPFSIWRAFMPTQGDADTIGVARMFFGYISKLEVTRSYVKITAASIIQTFQSQIPIQIIEPGDRGGSFIPPTTYDYAAQVSDPTQYGLPWSQQYIYVTFGIPPPFQDYTDGWILYEYDDFGGDVGPWTVTKWNPYYVRRIRSVSAFGIGALVYLYHPLPMMPWKFSIEEDTCYFWKRTSLSNTNSKAPGFPYVPIPETAL